MSIIEKAKQFFDLKKKHQQKRIDTLKKIIKQLDVKARELKKRMDIESDSQRREKMLQEHEAVKKIRAKSRRRLVRLKALKGSS